MEIEADNSLNKINTDQHTECTRSAVENSPLTISTFNDSKEASRKNNLNENHNFNNEKKFYSSATQLDQALLNDQSSCLVIHANKGII